MSEPTASASPDPRTLTAIAIVDRNGVIGDGVDQPFKIREDWARYKALTMGHPMIMGRKTFDAIGRALPGRTSIVVTRDPSSVAALEGVCAVGSFPEALERAYDLDDEVWVAGGGEIYRLAWSELTHLEITEVDDEAHGSVTFPEIGDDWRETARQQRDGYAFVSYERA